MTSKIMVPLVCGCILFSQSLPIAAKQPAAASHPAELVQTMHGYVSTTAPTNEVAGCIDEALSSAIQQSVEAQKALKNLSKFSRASRRAFKFTKDAANFMLCDRGFLPSMEGGQLMLDEKANVNSRSSAEYAKQRWLDTLHDKVVSDVVELVTGLGTSDPARAKEITDGALKSLQTTCGDSTAQHIKERLAQWVSQQTADSNAASNLTTQPVWSVKERQERVQLITNNVSKDDPIIKDVTKRVHKMSQHKKATVIGSQVVETALNAASLTPTIIGPATSAALLLFFMVTGGTEEDKLLSEMYQGKRYQSRRNSLENQAKMAIDAHQLAVQTHNVALLQCSEALVSRLGTSWTDVLKPPVPAAVSQATTTVAH